MKRLSVLIAVAALCSTACGGGEETASAAPELVVEGATGDETAAAATTDAATGTSDEELALEFARCMRDNGVADFPDPTLEADGSVTFFGGGGPRAGGFDPGDPSVQDANEVCGQIIQGATFLPGGGDTTELEDTLLEFAACLRDQGLDVDDPDLSGGFGPGAAGGGGLFGDGFDPNDPANEAALEECAGIFGAAGPFGGGN